MGNPGAQYAGTRHNVGFFFIDTLAQLSAADWTAKRGFFADWTKAEDLFLLRPQTFMNNSGRAVAAAAHFWRLSPEQIVVIHDEVDLAPGIAKLKFGGGARPDTTVCATSAAHWSRAITGVCVWGSASRKISTRMFQIMSYIGRQVRRTPPLNKALNKCWRCGRILSAATAKKRC